MNINNLYLISNVNIFKNIKDFLSSLTLIDVIFFFSVILLLILIVTLLYFIKLNEDIRFKDEVISDEEENKKDNIAIERKFSDDEEDELIDLESITKALENKESPNIDLTAFEEEQEKEAIISYDELINKAKYGTINYKSENMLDDLSVKEVDLENLINETTKPEIEETKSSFISYAQEEAFLEALKKLQKQIN